MKVRKLGLKKKLDEFSGQSTEIFKFNHSMLVLLWKSFFEAEREFTSKQ